MRKTQIERIELAQAKEPYGSVLTRSQPVHTL